MGLLVFAFIVLAGSLPFAVVQTAGALRWARQRRSEPAAPAKVYGTQSPAPAARPLGAAWARTTKFTG